MDKHVGVIYFTPSMTVGVDPTPKIFPRLPKETGSIKAISYKVISPTHWEKLGSASYPFSTPESVVELVELVQNTSPSRVYTVHAKSVLLRMYRWGLLKNSTTSMDIAPTFNILQGMTSDLCELCNYPAVLTLEERASFSFDDIAPLVGMPHVETEPPRELMDEILKRICMKFD